jgi:Leg1
MMKEFDVDAWQSGIGERKDLEGTCFESYWKELKVSDAVFDGFSFLGRMAIYKYLIFELDKPLLWNKAKNFWIFHWLWGYCAQLDWQYRSGRLHIGTSEQDMMITDKISPKSWWAYMNFGFSVCILLGAEKAGLMHGTRVKLDKRSQNLVTNDKGIQQCIDCWADLFREPYSIYKAAIQHTDGLKSDFAIARFEFQKEVWKAHTGVIRATVGSDLQCITNSNMSEMLDLLPEAERKFGLGWSRMVELLAAMCFPTHLQTLLRDGAGYLPLALVTDEYVKGSQKNYFRLSQCERQRLKSIEVTHNLYQAPSQMLHLVATFYRFLVQTPDVAEAMPSTVSTMTSGKPIQMVKATMRLVGLLGKNVLSFVRPSGILEFAIIVTVASGAVVALFYH